MGGVLKRDAKKKGKIKKSRSPNRVIGERGRDKSDKT